VRGPTAAPITVPGSSSSRRHKDWSADYEHPVVATVVVDVPANGEVEVELRLPEGFDPDPTP
jgi:hypothetical protein